MSTQIEWWNYVYSRCRRMSDEVFLDGSIMGFKMVSCYAVKDGLHDKDVKGGGRKREESCKDKE